ncbi:hypothetical protein DFH08DRAFT_887167 [Mycena albidolilacea]|uniref:Uncharacterized protein n=1 Tax=Mycena albidolilacea TaxID=1033008 RepID=A0AAD6ZID1_9AGAR|nr:hypothetical protein DFH08DRAFT_887167 [Mycena albidolilacea]
MFTPGQSSELHSVSYSRSRLHFSSILLFCFFAILACSGISERDSGQSKLGRISRNGYHLLPFDAKMWTVMWSVCNVDACWPVILYVYR